jgi:plastocyanin
MGCAPDEGPLRNLHDAHMKRIVLLITAAALVAAAGAAASKPAATVTIRHQTRHCHTWSVNGNSWKAAQSVRIARGASILFRNTDVMPHRLVEVSGPLVKLPKSSNMNHLAAAFTLTLPKAGTYRFKTVAGEDYMKGVKTTGEDNNLTLTIVVR